MVANVMTSAAREGARVGVLPDGTNSKITTAVQNEMTANGVASGNVILEVKVNGTVADASTAHTDQTVSVEVKVPFSTVSWMPSSLFIGQGTYLRGKAVMRRE